MPMPDKMDLNFDTTEIADLNPAFDTILNIMNSKKVVQLTDKERQGAMAASATRMPYIAEAISVLAVDFPNLQPGFLKLADAQKDLDASIQLGELAAKRNEVNDRMIDFAMASEHFAYQYMRKFYSAAQDAQSVNTPGADTVVNALSPLFENQGPANPPVPNP